MNQKDTRKTPLVRSDIVKNEQRLLLSQGALTLALAVIITACASFWTAITILGYADIPPVFLVLFIGIAIALWIFAAYTVFTTVKTNLPLLCLLTGKYTIELDRVQRIELRSERNYEYKRTLIGKLNKSDYITWQYVHFEKYGQFKTNPSIEVAQDAEYYLLVTLGKKPDILRFYSCEKYELVNE